MDFPRYKYQPLKRPDEIRVLKLSVTKTRLEIFLHHVAVTRSDFQALSYVWGDSEQESMATILGDNGEAIGWVPLTKNLSDAMYDLQDTRELKDEFFWIDQICINQPDDEEKGVQVAMMSKIFTHAKQVITYLGSAVKGEEEERGFRLLEKIYNNISSESWWQLRTAGHLGRAGQSIRNQTIRLEQLPSDLALAIDKSYEQDEISRRYYEQGWDWLIRIIAYGHWSQRLWIVQEQLLNETNIALRGNRLITWDAVVTMSILFSIGYLPGQFRHMGQINHENDVPFVPIESSLYSIWWNRQTRSAFRDSFTWPKLFTSLTWYQALLCRDARDRAYALLAISKDAATLDLKPDYTPLNTVDTLSKQISARMLKNEGDLHLLTFSAKGLLPNSTLPSWCYSLRDTREYLPLSFVPTMIFKPHPITSRKSVAGFLGDETILTVKGRILDSVSTENSKATWNVNQDGQSRIDFISSFINTIPESFTVRDIGSMFRVACPIVATHSQGSEDDTILFRFRALLRNSWSILEIENQPGTSLTVTKETIERCENILTHLEALVSFDTYPNKGAFDEEEADRSVWADCLHIGRVFGRTSAGRFFNALYTAQKGDSIVALQGADRLFMIRQAGETYRLIGEVYVDGLMRGEAYEGIDPDTVDYDIHIS